jgi:hypothetical protein
MSEPENDITARHVDDLAELFALGMLERDEAEFVTNHAATCGRCSLQLGLAEAAVVALVEATVPEAAAPEDLGARIRASAGIRARPREVERAVPRRNAFLAYGALAAALVFAVGTGFEVRAISDMRRAAAQNDVALVALVNSHFTHQTFAKAVPSAPTAKVLLGRSPHWLYVIVDSPACRCRVFATTASGIRDLGEPIPHRHASTLFVPDVAALSRLDLREDGRVVSTARIGGAGGVSR